MVEHRAAFPLVPLRLFADRNLATANMVGVLWVAGLSGWFFFSALYLQGVLGYHPLQVGLAFLPESVAMAAISLRISPRLVTRFGLKRPLCVGLITAAAGLLLLLRAPVAASYTTDVLPSMILVGLAAGLVFNPVLVAATNDVLPAEAGIASGIVNSSFMVGGAVGLAVLDSISTARTSTLLDSGHHRLTALTGGYHLAFAVGAGLILLAAGLGAFLLRPDQTVTVTRPRVADPTQRGSGLPEP